MSVPRRAMLVDDAIAPAASSSSAPRRAAEPATPSEAFVGAAPKVSPWKRSVAPLAAMAVLSVAVGMGAAYPQPIAPAVADDSLARSLTISRSQEREPIDEIPAAPTATPVDDETPATEAPTPTPTADPTPAVPALGSKAGTRYLSSSKVNLRAEPSTDAKVIKTLNRGEAVTITDVKVGDWQQVNNNGKAAWISVKFLVKTKPAEQKRAAGAPEGSFPSGGDYSTAPCKYSSGIESGITANTKRVFRAFCATFPTIKTYGGYRAGAESYSYHRRGAAIDAMVYDRDLGWQMAKWAAANADALNIDQVIYAQRIWTKSNRTWRPMADRGSVTANHYDHVHISVG